MKEEINKGKEILKKIKLKSWKHPISQIKTSIESLANRVKQVENRVSGMEVDELDESVKSSKKLLIKSSEKLLRKYEWNMQDHWDSIKRQKTYESWL
jgi:iron uptake system EfeUOB component EfeO/EfeM